MELQGGAAQESGQCTAQGTGKADWQEVFSDGTDPSAQAGTREEARNKKSISNGRFFLNIRVGL